MPEFELRTSVVRLRDGRHLAFSEFGDPHGAPVIHHHGMPGSRLDHQARLGVYRALGVRVIVPDRPGYGLSDWRPNANLVDWPQDVVELADAMGLERFAVTSLSGGGIYALACAAALPERVTRAVVTGCPAPIQIPGALEEMRFATRAGVWLGANAPWLLGAGVSLIAKALQRYPGFCIEEASRLNAPVDRSLLRQAFIKVGEEETMREALRHGARGYVTDIQLLSRPWGFAPEAIRVPVQLWHGDQDTVIPLGHARFLAAAIPGSALVVCPGEGHMLMWNHLEEIVRWARAGDGSRLVA